MSEFIDTLDSMDDSEVVDRLLLLCTELIIRHKFQLLKDRLQELELWYEGSQILKSILSDKEIRDDQ